MIHVLSGAGHAQRLGEPPQPIRPADTIWFEPGEKHWHGAGPATGMVHLAVQEALNGSKVDWLEEVSLADCPST